MSLDQLRVPALVVGAIVVLATGMWLTRAGWPYGTVLMTVHKLVALAAVVFIAVMLWQANRVAPLPVLQLTIAGLAAVAVVAAFASGAVVSASETAPAWVLWAHRTVPFLAAALSAASVWMVLGRG
jgi:hypothetical protein